MTAVANFDIAGMADRCNKFGQEMARCGAAGMGNFDIHAKVRAESYLSYLRDYLEVLCKPNDPLDLIASHPLLYGVRDFLTDESINAIENLCVIDIVRRFRAMWIELVYSQSKDRTTGLTAKDKERILALVENTEGIVSFGTSDLDLPENPTDTGPTLPAV